MSKFVLLAFVCLTSLAFAIQIVPIPQTYDGLTIGHKNAPVQIEAFYDLLCPASWAANDEINTLFTNATFAQYLPNIAFTIHQFPLPYHDYAYSFSQLFRYVKDTFSTKTAFNFINFVFEIQESFYNSETNGFSRNIVLNTIANVAHDRFPQISVNQALTALNAREYDLKTRKSWKYGCSRQVSGTPTFFLNGVELSGASGFSSTIWAQTLLPYLQNAAPQSETNIQEFYQK